MNITMIRTIFFFMLATAQLSIAPLANLTPAVSVETKLNGKLDTVTYYSETVGGNRKAVVYLPPGFTEKKKYPVLYLLHGIGGDEFEWLNQAHPETILDQLYQKGALAPMLVVMPNGRAMLDDRAIGNVMEKQKVDAFANFEKDLIHDLIPCIQKKYLVNTDRSHRAIAGLSMGGGQALNFGLGNLERFAWIGGFSPAPNTRVGEKLVPNVKKARKQIKLLWISCGTSDNLLPISKQAHQYLTQQHIEHTYIEQPGKHDFEVWKKDLEGFVQLLFKK